MKKMTAIHVVVLILSMLLVGIMMIWRAIFDLLVDPDLDIAIIELSKVRLNSEGYSALFVAGWMISIICVVAMALLMWRLEDAEDEVEDWKASAMEYRKKARELRAELEQRDLARDLRPSSMVIDAINEQVEMARLAKEETLGELEQKEKDLRQAVDELRDCVAHERERPERSLVEAVNSLSSQEKREIAGLVQRAMTEEK